MQPLLSYKRRPVVYAIVLTLCFAFLMTLLEATPEQFFGVSSVLIYLILLFEIYTTKFYSAHLLKQFQLPEVTTRDTLAQFIHHATFPSLFYLSMLGFIYFNRQPSLNIIILAIVFTTFYILFTNIRAYYEDKFVLEERTHNIYDFLSIIVVFLAGDSILNIFQYQESNVIIPVLFLGALFVSISVLTLLRYSLLNFHFGKITIGALLGAIITLVLLLLSQLSNFSISVIYTLYFYYYLALINHEKDKSLSPKVIMEYIVVFLICIVILSSIS